MDVPDCLTLCYHQPHHRFPRANSKPLPATKSLSYYQHKPKKLTLSLGLGFRLPIQNPDQTHWPPPPPLFALKRPQPNQVCTTKQWSQTNTLLIISPLASPSFLFARGQTDSGHEPGTRSIDRKGSHTDGHDHGGHAKRLPSTWKGSNPSRWIGPRGAATSPTKLRSPVIPPMACPGSFRATHIGRAFQGLIGRGLLQNVAFQG